MLSFSFQIISLKIHRQNYCIKSQLAYNQIKRSKKVKLLEGCKDGLKSNDNKTQEAIMSAQSLAVSHHHQEVDTVHLLLALLEEQDGLAVRIFQK